MHVISESGASGPLGLGRREKFFFATTKHIAKMPVRQVYMTR